MQTINITKRVKAGVAAVALLGLGLFATANIDQQISTQIAVPARLTGTVTIDCENSPGPQITLDGNLVIGGLNARIIFANNVKGTHTYIENVTGTSGVLLPEGTSITIPKQPVLGGVGGNPFIWIQFLDENDNPLTGEIYLGRCVQGLAASINPTFYLDSAALANVHVDCANNPGPFITVNGDLTLPGLQARFIFRNNDNPVGGPHEADAIVDTTLLVAGLNIKFPKQPVLGGVGGNPWMWLQFAYPDGTPASEEYLLGRCVQSSK